MLLAHGQVQYACMRLDISTRSLTGVFTRQCNLSQAKGSLAKDADEKVKQEHLLSAWPRGWLRARALYASEWDAWVWARGLFASMAWTRLFRSLVEGRVFRAQVFWRPSTLWI